MVAHRVLLAAIAAITLMTRGAQARGSSNESLYRRVDALLAGHEAQLIELDRDIHRHPEVSGAEERTAGIVTARLRELDLEVKTGVGGHGVVGLLRVAKPGPLIGYQCCHPERVAEVRPRRARSFVAALLWMTAAGGR